MKQSANTRTIHTNLFSDKAFCCCSSVLGQLSDGWGEDSPRNDRYWRYAKVARALDGEVLILVSTNYYMAGCERENAFINMTDEQVKEFFAKMLKKTAYMELNYCAGGKGWRRDNTKFYSQYIGHLDEKFGAVVSIAEAYCVYESLLGRKFSKKYPQEVLDKVIGVKRSAEEAKAAKDLSDKKKKIEQNWNEARNALYEEEKKAIEGIKEKYKLLRDAGWKKYEAAMAELKASQIA